MALFPVGARVRIPSNMGDFIGVVTDVRTDNPALRTVRLDLESRDPNTVVTALAEYLLVRSPDEYTLAERIRDAEGRTFPIGKRVVARTNDSFRGRVGTIIRYDQMDHGPLAVVQLDNSDSPSFSNGTYSFTDEELVALDAYPPGTRVLVQGPNETGDPMRGVVDALDPDAPRVRMVKLAEEHGGGIFRLGVMNLSLDGPAPDPRWYTPPPLPGSTP